MNAELERNVGGLRCREVLALLEEYLDDTLAPGEQARVEAHVRECARCATFGHSYSRVVAAMHEALRQDELEPAVAQRLEERLRAAMD